jgi:hypothetical protein
VVSHVGSGLLRLLGDEVGLTSALSKALRERGFHPDIGVVAATLMQKLDANENARPAEPMTAIRHPAGWVRRWPRPDSHVALWPSRWR